MTITPRDRDRLRTVAAEYAAITGSPKMAARRELWRRSNRLLERTVPFQIEDNGSFFRDLTPPPECEGEFARGCEAQMLHAITNHRLIDDDRIFPHCFQVHWAVSRSGVCPELSYRRSPDATGRELGYETNTPLADLATGLGKLRPTEFSVDREGTHERLAAATAAFGDILPVQLVGRSVSSAGTSLAGNAVLLMGMDTFYMAMLDQPENVHRFFEFLVQDAERYVAWLEAEKLITTGNHEFDCGSGSCVHTDELPRRSITEGEAVHPEDCWGFVEAQEAVGISPAMYAEFIHPYQRRIGDRFGLMNYGCCEPVHAFWATLQGFHSLRKVTVSPWCDVPSISASAGKQVVLSRKPHPMKLCGPAFSPAELEADLRETLAITADNFVELIFRDTCPLCGAMLERVAEACRIVRRLVGRE